jgi:hypothetical protein
VAVFPSLMDRIVHLQLHKDRFCPNFPCKELGANQTKRPHSRVVIVRLKAKAITCGDPQKLPRILAEILAAKLHLENQFN